MQDVAEFVGSPQAIERYSGLQRHRSWMIEANNKKYWLKVCEEQNRYSSNHIEASSLKTLARYGLTPLLIAEGRGSYGTFILTENLVGTQLTQLDDAKIDPIRLLSSLRIIHSSVAAAIEHNDPPHSIYSPAPDARQCMQFALNQASAADRVTTEVLETSLIGRIIPFITPTHARVRVHGSLDFQNIVVAEDNTYKFLDLEASRLGSPLTDLATILDNLVQRKMVDAAREILNNSIHAHEVIAFLLTRILFRIANGYDESQNLTQTEFLIDHAAAMTG